MTWTRVDDNWCDSPQLQPLDLAARWHYFAMIQFCSRTRKYDGVLRLVDARRCSDVDDPSEAVGQLIETGLLENIDGATLRVVHIEDHIPPPSVRNAAEKVRVRVARHRKHKNGDHSSCNAGCNALPQDGTGQDGPGQAVRVQEAPRGDQKPQSAAGLPVSGHGLGLAAVPDQQPNRSDEVQELWDEEFRRSAGDWAHRIVS